MERPPILLSTHFSEVGFEHGFGTRYLAAPALPEDLRMARQVHGTRLLWADEPVGEDEEADALASSRGALVGIRTADCVPVLLGDRRTGAVAAIHAGWKGGLAGIVGVAVQGLRDRGCLPDDLLAAIGPCVGRCCYEVSSQLAERFAIAIGDAVVTGRRLDLRSVVRSQLLRAGVGEAAIDEVGGCTHCEAELFHSFRRDGERAGRQISFIRAGSVS